MHIYDSVAKRKLPFTPLHGRDVTIYVCGPTVYDDAHLGHARSAVAFDILRRTFEMQHYNVTFAKNVTDIDDKIINKAIEQKRSISDVAGEYLQSYERDMAALNVKSADISPKATQSLEAMTQMIQTLLDKECAYQTPNGDIYFDTSKDDDYGCIAQRNEDETQTKQRVESSDEKRNVKDFALWKASQGEFSLSSPFGTGRPGWHLECSAMIEKHFQGTIDIHGGGADLLFPHHENEAAQTRCATGHKIANYWMHNGFVRINGEKMSKSLGNSFFIKDALQNYHGEVLRFYLLSSHYRQDFNFSEEDLLASKKRLDKLYRLKKRLGETAAAKKPEAQFAKGMLEAMNDDLNTSKALALLDEMVAQGNEALDLDPKDKGSKKLFAANLDFVGKLLGVGLEDPFRYFQFGLDPRFIEQIEALIAKRAEAKKAKDFAAADAIRDEIAAMGITLMDTPNGTVWEKSG